ncbi:transcriptional regulator, partial [Mammaliicoccus sciuri]
YNIVQSRLEMGILNDTDKKQLDIALFLSEQSKKHNITILIRDLMKTL